MRNNEIGIARIKSIFAIILIIGIICGGTISTKKLLKANNEKDIKTDLLYIQAKCKVIYDKHIINAEEPLLGDKITEYEDNAVISDIIDKSEKDWYKLSQDNLNEIGEGHLKEEDGYIVNYEDEEVIYTSGIEHEGVMYYKLSDILNWDEKKEDESAKQEEPEYENIINEEIENEVIENTESE